MEWLCVVVPAVVAGVAGVCLLLEAPDRWGVSRAPVAAGEGAYRAGRVTRETARRVPLSVVTAALLTSMWGAITLVVLVPAGAVLAAMLVGSHEPRVVIGALVVGASLVSGTALAFTLFRAGHALAHRAAGAPSVARATALHAVCHHALIWVLFPLPLLLDPYRDAGPAYVALAVPCGIGLVVALVVLVAGRRVAALDAEDQARISTSSPIEISTDS
ncbi:hypothetical protein [Sandaracinus amylolyticus]|uniref:hypothetical protein n=1 Tax=Sandaracinus amylolyticus TaxID=927083 RepID=UPI00069E11D8|nr:hypothetical protein [Sandaracinus amylolyticus]